MAEDSRCDLCGRTVLAGSGYIVRIDVFADPELPAMSAEQIAHADFNGTLAGLLAQMKQMSADELQDGVHRRFEYRLCPSCHHGYLANPLGLPRIIHLGKN